MFLFMKLVCVERHKQIGVCNTIQMARNHFVGLWCIWNRGMGFGDLSSDFASGRVLRNSSGNVETCFFEFKQIVV